MYQPTHFSRKAPRDFFSPPKTVTVEGREYPIRWDFETAFRFMEYVDRSEDDDETFLNTVLSLWYPLIPENRDAAMEAAVTFYCGGTPPKKGYYAPAFPPQTCREDFYLAFLSRYGIDLNKQTLHWWIFRRLAEGLRKERRTPWTETRSQELPEPNFPV